MILRAFTNDGESIAEMEVDENTTCDEVMAFFWKTRGWDMEGWDG